MKYYTKAAKKFLDLNWEQKIYKNLDLDLHERTAMMGLTDYEASLRMCKRNFGVTFKEFFKFCKVAGVKQYLSNPENRQYYFIEKLPELGYNFQSLFNREFKEVTGMTPREFRYFQEHFIELMGLSLAEYEQPALKRYMPPDNKPTFVSNFLNAKAMQIEQYEEQGFN